MEYDRNKLIDIAERAVVPHKFWSNRDSSAAQRQAGEALALLRANCFYAVLDNPASSCCTNEKTIWLEISFKDFSDFEEGEGSLTSKRFYLPTDDCLNKANGRDWY